MVAYANKMGFTTPALTNAAGTAKWTNGDAFINVLTNAYWSSSAAISLGPWQVWTFQMNYGYPALESIMTKWHYVWPVRGGQSEEFGSINNPVVFFELCIHKGSSTRLNRAAKRDALFSTSLFNHKRHLPVLLRG